MATKKKVKKEKKQRYFGTVKVKAGCKVCWVAKEDKHGFSLGIGFNNRTVWLTGLRFKNHEEVTRALGAGVNFIYTRDSKLSPEK